jgi:hypothetical protein
LPKIAIENKPGPRKISSNIATKTKTFEFDYFSKRRKLLEE